MISWQSWTSFKRVLSNPLHAFVFRLLPVQAVGAWRCTSHIDLIALSKLGRGIVVVSSVEMVPRGELDKQR